MAIQFEMFYLIRRQNGECNVRSFGQSFFGMNPDVPAFKSAFLQVTLNFELK